MFVTEHHAMHPIRNALCLTIALFAIACQSEREACSEIQSLFGAQSVSVAYGSAASTSTGSVRYATVKLNGVPRLNEYRRMDFVTSRAAFIYYGGMDEEQRSKYDEIRVELKGNGSTYGKAYFVADMPDFAQAKDIAESYLESLVAGDYHAQDASLDREFLPDSAMRSVNDTYLWIDSVQGPFVSGTIVGYESATAKSGMPLLMVYADATVHDSLVYNFSFAMNRQNKKLASISFE